MNLEQAEDRDQEIRDIAVKIAESCKQIDEIADRLKAIMTGGRPGDGYAAAGEVPVS